MIKVENGKFEHVGNEEDIIADIYFIIKGAAEVLGRDLEAFAYSLFHAIAIAEGLGNLDKELYEKEELKLEV